MYATIVMKCDLQSQGTPTDPVEILGDRHLISPLRVPGAQLIKLDGDPITGSASNGPADLFLVMGILFGEIAGPAEIVNKTRR
jgi:hypothetical protein